MAWENDKLERKHYAPLLTNILSSSEKPFVVSLTAAYGTGKTYFLQNWKEELTSEPNMIPAVYFNAWETDFAKDPIIAFIHEVKKFIALLGTGINFILRRGLPIAAKLTARYALGNIIEDETNKVVEDGIEKSAESFLDQYDQDIEDMDTFKKGLAKIAEKVFYKQSYFWSKNIYPD